MSSRLRRWPELCLVLTFCALRLRHLLALPGFFDEAIHIRWAKLVWAGQFSLAAADGRLLNVWAYALFFPFEAGLWIARNVEVLLATLGFAALMTAGRRLFSRRVALIAALLYAIIPLAFFYERMALVDPFAAPLVSLTLLAVVVGLQLRRDDPATGRWLAAAGLLLAALLLTKLTNLLFAPLPLLAALILSSRDNRRRAAREVILIYTVAAVPVGVVVGALRLVAHSDLGLALVSTRTAPAPILGRLTANAASLYDFARAYLGWPVMLMIAAGFIAALLSRDQARWLVLTAAAPPLGALLAGTNVVESRFLVPVLPLLALMAGWGTAEALEKISSLTQKPNTNYTNNSHISRNPWRIQWVMAAVGSIAVLASGPARFLWLAWDRPGELPLAAPDRFEYVEGWPAGFGIREAA
ncbi:MAG: glycosyltransferase family 39 protein, partial [Chloroflexi bacterium]|nr:glycosyltransferase family 39 protein [Chloroflexota bacterium]